MGPPLDLIAGGPRALLGPDDCRNLTGAQAVPTVLEKLRELRGDAIAPERSAREGSRHAETHAPPRVVGLILTERHDELRPARPERLARRPDTALMNDRAAARHHDAVGRVLESR